MHDFSGLAHSLLLFTSSSILDQLAGAVRVHLKMTIPDGPCDYNYGDVTWMLTSSVLVLGMIPGLALFEAGLLRLKNSVSIMTQCLAGLILLASLWILLGFTLTFGPDVGGVIGNFKHAFFMNVPSSGCWETKGQRFHIPPALFAVFQMMFACVTPLLVTGTVAERMRWKPYLAFTVLWEMMVYYPVAHWIWGDGWLAQLGTQDFAGGIVIHTSSGVASLATAILLGRRQDYDKYHGHFPHSDFRVATIGAAFLWIGWFGFNGGSALASSSTAVQAVLNTQTAACFSGVVWMIWEWTERKPTVLGILNGVISGMAGVTPASGFISTPSAIILGVVLGIASRCCTKLLLKARVDDALEVSCVHGATGVIGSLAIGVAASSDICDTSANGLIYGGGFKLLGLQALGVAVVFVYSGVCSLLILFVIGRLTRLRARAEHEERGLDFSHHRVNTVYQEIANLSRAARDEI